MKSCVKLLEYKSYKRVTYYSLQHDDDEDCKFEMFLKRFQGDPETEEDLLTMIYWIKRIGDRLRAKKELFRPENAAVALPPPVPMAGEVQTGDLRLYCVWISEQIIILCDGGIKTKRDARDCPNVSPHFFFADAIAGQIQALIKEGSIEVLDRKLNFDSSLRFKY